MNRDEMYLSLGVSEKVLAFGETVLDELKPRFAEIDEIAELNQVKVIAAMQENRVNATHFAASTGYGYDDEGRDNLERVVGLAGDGEQLIARQKVGGKRDGQRVRAAGDLRADERGLGVEGAGVHAL